MEEVKELSFVGYVYVKQNFELLTHMFSFSSVFGQSRPRRRDTVVLVVLTPRRCCTGLYWME